MISLDCKGLLFSLRKRQSSLVDRVVGGICVNKARYPLLFNLLLVWGGTLVIAEVAEL